MQHPRSLLQIDFDQYQRYAAVAVLLKPLLAAQGRTRHDPIRILEVGCHTLNLLPEFLAPLPVEVVRADVDEGLGDGTGPYVTLVKDEPYPFGDAAFDYVVALEVLEHIPGPQRHFAFTQWARVARDGVLFSCPNGNRVAAAERRADRDYRVRHDAAHPWLQEHDRFGRPTARQVRALCESIGLTCHRFLNSPLSEWLPLLLATERTWEQGSPAAARRLNELLNRRPFRAFIRQAAYRCVYAAFKSPAAAQRARQHWDESEMLNGPGRTVDPVRLLAQTFTTILQQQDRRQADVQRLGRLERECMEQQRRLQQLERESTWQRWELEIGRSRRARLAARWRSLRRWLGRGSRPILHQARASGLQGQGPGRWVADGPDPQLVWSCDYQTGWHRLTLAGRARAGRQVTVYLDYGHGFDEQHALHLGAWPDGPARWSTFAYFHHPVRRLRLDPADGPTQLRIDEFSVQPVRAASVAWAGLRRWVRERPAANGLSFIRQLQQLATSPCEGQARSPYEAWLLAQRPSLHEREQKAARLGAASTAAVLLHLDANTDVAGLRRTLSSVLGQDVRPTEVWVAAPQHDLATWQQERGWDRFQDCLRWVPTSPGTPWSRVWHDCAEQSTATLLVPLEAGDVLEPDALLEMLDHARRHPHAALLYADEDVWHRWHGYQQPALKPDVAPETLRLQPQLLGVAVAVRTEALRTDGLDPAYEGALLPEYCLRLIDEGRDVVHVRRVLWHTTERGLKGGAPKVLTRLVNQHQERRERQFAQARLPLVSIIIPSAGRSVVIDSQPHTHLGRCLASLRARSRYDNYEMIVVDNGALPGEALTELTRHGAVRVSVPGPFNFSRNLNHAVRRAQGAHLLFLNDDTEIISPDWIEQLLHYSCQEGIGAVGAKLFFPTGLLQHVGIALSPAGPGHPYYGQPGDAAGYQRCCVEARNWIAVTGACLMSPRPAFEAIGGFDETFELNYNDVDYCLRLNEAGYRCVVNPKAELYHFETQRADGRAPFRPEELARFQARWAGRYPHDPFFTDEPRQAA